MAYADGETRGNSFATIPPGNLGQSSISKVDCSRKNNDGSNFDPNQE